MDCLYVSDYNVSMSELEITKEKIAYLKFWLGIMVVSDISLVGWLLSNVAAAPEPKTLGAIIGIFVITISSFLIHKRIERLILTLREL